MGDLVRGELNCVADAIAKRGDALDLNRLFMQTPLPMVLVCNDLHVQAANPAGQLYPRRRVADLRSSRSSSGVLRSTPRPTSRTASDRSITDC
jgi:hypothetical protein